MRDLQALRCVLQSQAPCALDRRGAPDPRDQSRHFSSPSTSKYVDDWRRMTSADRTGCLSSDVREREGHVVLVDQDAHATLVSAMCVPRAETASRYLLGFWGCVVRVSVQMDEVVVRFALNEGW